MLVDQKIPAITTIILEENGSMVTPETYANQAFTLKDNAFNAVIFEGLLSNVQIS